MKFKILLGILIISTSINISCTPTSLDDNLLQKSPTPFSTGDELSTRTDDDKD